MIPHTRKEPNCLAIMMKLSKLHCNSYDKTPKAQNIGIKLHIEMSVSFDSGCVYSYAMQRLGTDITGDHHRKYDFLKMSSILSQLYYFKEGIVKFSAKDRPSEKFFSNIFQNTKPPFRQKEGCHERSQRVVQCFITDNF